MRYAEILRQTERYYTDKIEQHGPTPAGVDWESRAAQELRFAQLINVCDVSRPFSINDYGCGYGALLDHLEAAGLEVDYRGFDVSERMLEHARERHPGREWVEAAEQLRPAEFTVASGLFNLKLDVDDSEWRDYVVETIAALDALSERGFAFNMLTSYSDPPLMRPDLYYGDPLFFFDHCKRRFARNVALLHDYDLYEFTIIVRK